MADRVRVTVHHQKGVLSPCHDEVGSIVAGARRVGEKMFVAIFTLEIFHSPGTPKRFDLFFRKIHQLENQLSGREYRTRSGCRAWFSRRIKAKCLTNEP